ncbi:AAA family ATPase [Modestobacter versicolor]|uniref:AAA family ATPase n=1 Tax=Modestobacter versicolor TaxID=429133 RepID=UPI0034DF486E
MAVVLVTGMSGVGKSTVLGELARRGHAVVDTDGGGWIELVPEPLWREDRVTALLDGHTAGHLFLAGTVANQGRLYPRFDAVVLLSAPVEVLLERVAARTTNDFGKAADERRRIVADTEQVEPLLRARATVEVDTRRPLADVVDVVLRAATDPR